MVPLHMQDMGRPHLPRSWRIHKIDITEIPGSDNLHYAQGMIMEAQKRAATIFGAQRTYFLVNGTTVGIQAMILSHCKPGDQLLVPRNCHRSVWSALILGDIQPVYIPPETHPQTGIGLSVSPESVEECLRRHPHVKGALITYPTFYGTCSDIRAIADLLHREGKYLLVDEAHGAHFAFHGDLPMTALEGGGDMVAQSTHKLLSSFTQSSMLHVGHGEYSLDRLELFLSMLQSSSPSYPLMASLEFAALEAEREGARRWDQILEWNRHAYEKIRGFTPFRPLGKDLLGRYGVVDYDASRLLVDVSPLGLSGIQVDGILRRDYGIQVELSDHHYILAMTGMGTVEEDIQRFTTALIDIYNQNKGCPRKMLPSNTRHPRGACPIPQGCHVCRGGDHRLLPVSWKDQQGVYHPLPPRYSHGSSRGDAD